MRPLILLQGGRSLPATLTGMPRRPLATLAALAVLAVPTLAACGGDDGGSADARDLLDRAFSTPIESGRLDVAAEVQVDGVERLDDPIRLQLRGPFAGATGQGIPRLDWDVSFSGAGLSLSGGLVVTADNAFVEFQGTDYEVGEERFAGFEERLERDGRERTLADLGIDASDWVEEPEVEGDEEVAGAETTKVAGTVDVLAVVDDLAEAAEKTGGDAAPLELTDEQREQLEDVVEDAAVEVFVAKDDGTLRRLSLDVEFEVPEDQREDVGGAEGGSASLDVTLAGVGQEQPIQAPEDAKPLSELLSRFGIGAESLLR